MSIRRLFLFAAYDAQGIIGPSLIFHVRSLSEYGDVVVVMDNDSNSQEICRLQPHAVHVEAERHGEYDFGSYKRAWIWSMEHLDMDGYDYCYLVNDSVLGPLEEIGPLLTEMEGLGTEAFGPVINNHRREPHIQSWFVGMGRKVFLSKWFGDFIISVTHQEDMSKIYSLYEIGLTGLMEKHGIKCGALFFLKGKSIYNSVRKIYMQGLPFIKKSAITRHNASLGAEVKYVLDQCRASGSAYKNEAAEAVLEDCRRVYGEEYMDYFLSPSRMEMQKRYIIYLFNKVFKRNNHG